MEDYGHSRIEDAIETAQAAEVDRLVLFHHAPTRTDDELDAIVNRFRQMLTVQGSALQLLAAAEGMELVV